LSPRTLYSSCEVFSPPPAAPGFAHPAGRERLAPYDRSTLLPVCARLNYGEPDDPIDLVTCFRRRAGGHRCVHRVSDYRGRDGRRKLYRALAANRYSIMGMVCSAEPIMTKWKWALAARLPAKVFVINENGDYFWLDRGHWRAILHFALFRAGLTGSGAARTLGRLLVFPFTLLYLLLYASAVHIRRACAWRKGYR
jgi:hypothetical protein